MTQARLGTYRESEHFDNPAKANDPQEQRAVSSHIAPGGALEPGETGIGTIAHNFRLAASAGRTEAGLQQYGRAMHTTEDFFAHTNFVRIAMRLRDQRSPSLTPARYPAAPTPAATGSPRAFSTWPTRSRAFCT